MTHTHQIEQLHNMRQTKVNGLLNKQIGARQNCDMTARAHDQAVQRYETMRTTAPHDFGALFEATSDLDDPHSRFQSVARTVLQNRRTIEAARRAMMDAEEVAAQAQLHLQHVTQDLTLAKSQLEAITVVLDGLIQQQQIHADNQADEAALDDFAARPNRKTLWA